MLIEVKSGDHTFMNGPTMTNHFVCYSLLAFLGLQPLWGTGVTSVTETTLTPPDSIPFIAPCNKKKETKLSLMEKKHLQQQKKRH